MLSLPPFPEHVLATMLAACLGAAIGAEREWRRHPGGLRSCALVCAAACVFARVAVDHGGSATGAGFGAVASGVGFIGAGVIMHNAAHVRGLSTAATFWAVAAIGVATGVYEFGLAFGLGAVVLFAHVALRRLSSWIEVHAPHGDAGPQ